QGPSQRHSLPREVIDRRACEAGHAVRLGSVMKLAVGGPAHRERVSLGEASMTKVVELELEGDSVEGIEGGFMAVRRLRLRNVRADGSRSRPYVCDFLVRPKGIDAVVIAVYHRDGDRVRVLLREGLRPVLAKGRDP